MVATALAGKQTIRSLKLKLSPGLEADLPGKPLHSYRDSNPDSDSVSINLGQQVSQSAGNSVHLSIIRSTGYKAHGLEQPLDSVEIVERELQPRQKVGPAILAASYPCSVLTASPNLPG